MIRLSKNIAFSVFFLLKGAIIASEANVENQILVHPERQYLGHRIVGKDSLRFSYPVEVSNLGDSDIVLEFAKTSCGCAVVEREFPAIIKPKEKIMVDVALNLEGTYGTREATIIFGFTSGELRKTILSASSENLVMVFPNIVKMFPTENAEVVKKPFVISRFFSTSGVTEYPEGRVVRDNGFSIEGHERKIIKNLDQKSGNVVSVAVIDKMYVTHRQGGLADGELLWEYSDGIKVPIPVEISTVKIANNRVIGRLVDKNVLEYIWPVDQTQEVPMNGENLSSYLHREELKEAPKNGVNVQRVLYGDNKSFEVLFFAKENL